MYDGWISLHRKVKNNWVWHEGSFDYRSAWIDLLLEANSKPMSVKLGKDIIELPKGGKITSIKKLSSDWGWSMGKVKNFLTNLQKTGMIEFKSDTKKTVITILNYENYQTTNRDHQENGLQQTIKDKDNNKDINNNIDPSADPEPDPAMEDVTEIIEHLNFKTGASYKSTTAKTQKLIKARIKEGHDITDFIQVINNKCDEWANTDMSKYLRPETLFGTKFESYLNQQSKGQQIQQQDHSYIENNCWNQEQGKDYWNS